MLTPVLRFRLRCVLDRGIGQPVCIRRLPMLLWREVSLYTRRRHERDDILGRAVREVLERDACSMEVPFEQPKADCPFVGAPCPCAELQSAARRQWKNEPRAEARRLAQEKEYALQRIGAPDATGPLDDVVRAEFRARARSAILQLTTLQQMVLEKRLDGWTLANISMHIGRSRSEVRAALGQAIRRLKSLIPDK